MPRTLRLFALALLLSVVAFAQVSSSARADEAEDGEDGDATTAALTAAREAVAAAEHEATIVEKKVQVGIATSYELTLARIALHGARLQLAYLERDSESATGAVDELVELAADAVERVATLHQRALVTASEVDEATIEQAERKIQQALVTILVVRRDMLERAMKLHDAGVVTSAEVEACADKLATAWAKLGSALAD